MIIEINPLDTLFFRDGKPFSMGEDTWANGIFPPPPSVIYGALRSAYFAEHIDELRQANQNDDPTKGLRIKGIYYSIEGKIYLFLPYDCVKEKENKEKPVKVSALSMEENADFNSCPADYVLSYKDGTKVENVPDGLIEESMFGKYLDLREQSFPIFKFSDYVLSEPKIGIGRSSKTHSSEESRLYRVDMVRLQNKKGSSLSIVIDFEGLNLPGKGMMKFGGEGKAVSYNKYKKGISIEFPEFGENSKQFKIILSTPAIFNKGWIPEWMDEDTLIGDYNGLRLKLLTGAIGKPINVGGFDMKAKKPKSMYKAVPAGSVYYFELISGTMKKAGEVFHQKAISDVYSEQGFGTAFAGRAKR